MQKDEINKGLNDIQVIVNREKYGSNKLLLKERSLLFSSLLNTVSEPMFIILVISSGIYFYTNAYDEGILMIVSIILVSGISFYQEYRSKNSIQALKKMSVAKAVVIRNNIKQDIHADDIVVEDILVIEEGDIIPADGSILYSNDLLINESVLTGEAVPVIKSSIDSNIVYRGTLVSSGSATIKVISVGNETALGKIGKSLEEISIEKTPLQIQIKHFVKYMVIIGSAAFLLVVIFDFINTHDLIASLMNGLTLSMSILPEEIPVAFTTFQALGAYRLLKKNKIIVKQPQYVETLGTATVICADKTGTITENEMTITALYDYQLGKTVNPNEISYKSTMQLIEWAMWSSEQEPFDPMEKAIHELYKSTHQIDRRKEFQQIHEYPLSGKPPIMTHIFKGNHELIVAAKGGTETLIKQSQLNNVDKIHLEETIKLYAKKGLRVIAVGKTTSKMNEWPDSQDKFNFEFLGLIAFKDPPKKNIAESIAVFHKAGIQFKMITGDFSTTAVAIAREINIQNPDDVITGDQILLMQPKELKTRIKNVNVFARMFPDAKLKIIEALKANGEITAMTGDGVNDGPALKAAHIGIAMGSKGTEVAKNAASLIIIDNDLSHMTDAIELGRRIYDNLTKAVQYIISIHIPIILIVLLGSFYHFTISPIFSPVHVIFLELIMGPTCSILYENEPVEKGAMLKPPRKNNITFLSKNQLMLSVVQGLMITAGCLFCGYYLNKYDNSDHTMRTAVFFCLLCSNLFLTLTNRSRFFSVFSTFKYKNYLLPVMILTSVGFMAIIQFSSMGRSLFDLRQLSLMELLFCLLIAIIATGWFEIYKWIKRKLQPI